MKSLIINEMEVLLPEKNAGDPCEKVYHMVMFDGKLDIYFLEKSGAIIYPSNFKPYSTIQEWIKKHQLNLKIEEMEVLNHESNTLHNRKQNLGFKTF